MDGHVAVAKTALAERRAGKNPFKWAQYSFAVRTVSDWNQLPAVVVEQENPAAFKAQLARSAPAGMP